MITFYIDADGCPVKEEVFRVARRYGLKVYLVANSWMRVPEEELFELVLVKEGLDAADDWIVEHIHENDIAVTDDVPLAARCVAKGASALDPRGRVFTDESIGLAVANRDLMAFLRDTGSITGGPAPYGKRDRSRFLQRLDELVQSSLRAPKQNENTRVS